MSIPKLSAHRGGPEDRFEPNSLDAIKNSLDLGVDLIEFDVRATKDGKFITYHDDSIVVDGVPRLIEDITEADALANAKDAVRVLDVLALIKGRAMGHVDLKDTRLELEIADLCEAALGRDGFILTTLEDISVKRLRDARPNLRVGLSLGRDTEGMSKRATVRIRLSELFPGRRVRACRANMLAVNHKLAKLGVLRWAIAHKLDVLVWTINDRAMIESVIKDERYWAFTTDYPRIAVELRGS